jgi:hypothetical protein
MRRDEKWEGKTDLFLSFALSLYLLSGLTSLFPSSPLFSLLFPLHPGSVLSLYLYLFSVSLSSSSLKTYRYTKLLCPSKIKGNLREERARLERYIQRWNGRGTLCALALNPFSGPAASNPTTPRSRYLRETKGRSNEYLCLL